jgi:hypothetical protein
MRVVKSFLIALVLSLGVFGLAGAAFTGPNRTATTTSWERQYCNYRATVLAPAGSCLLSLYYPPGSCPSASSVASFFNNALTACGSSWPGTCGAGLSCSIALLTGSTQSCSSGETGCTGSTSTLSLPPATVSGTTDCVLPGQNGWCRGAATLNLAGIEPLTGYSITGFEGSPGMLCSGAACTWGFPEGTTTLDFWALSSWGDTSTLSTASMRVDSLPPVLTLEFPPADGLNGWYVTGPVSVTASASDATSGLSAPASINAGGSSFTASSDGMYLLSATVADLAGNSTSASGSIALDTTPPLLSVSVPAPDGSNGWFRSWVLVSASASDPTSGLAGLGFRLDGGSWTSGTGTDIPEGVHTLEFQARDQAGNITSLARSLAVDTTAPQSTFTLPPEGSTSLVHGGFTMSGQTLDLTSGPSAAEISLDGGTTWQPLVMSGGIWSATWDTTTVPNGTYPIQVRARDEAGNEEQTARITVVVANSGPAVQITRSWWLWEQAELSIQAGVLPVTGAQLTISDGLGHFRRYTFTGDELPGSLKWDGIWNDGLFAPPGAFSAVVSAWDVLGNTGQDTGLVQIPAPHPTSTLSPPSAPAQTVEAPRPSVVVPAQTVLPEQVVIPAPIPAPLPEKSARPSSPPRSSPLHLWPSMGLVGLLAALASAALSDQRPSALHRLEGSLLRAASRSPETKKPSIE